MNVCPGLCPVLVVGPNPTLVGQKLYKIILKKETETEGERDCCSIMNVGEGLIYFTLVR